MRPVCRRMVSSLAFAVLFVASSYARTLDAPVVRVVDGDSLIVLADRQEVAGSLERDRRPGLEQRACECYTVVKCGASIERGVCNGLLHVDVRNSPLERRSGLAGWAAMARSSTLYA
jgi:hypothetical protein